MKTHFQFTDKEFENKFKNGDLDPALFNHEAHIRLAWLHITLYGLDEAINNIDGQLMKYVTSLSAQEKYNKTVTIAAVKAVYYFSQKSESHTFEDFISEFPRIITNFKDLLAQHYSIDIFNSEIAKSSFLEPNLAPFT